MKLNKDVEIIVRQIERDLSRLRSALSCPSKASPGTGGGSETFSMADVPLPNVLPHGDLRQQVDRELAKKGEGQRPGAEQLIRQLRDALAPLAAVADAYDGNDLDEARPEWGLGIDHDAENILLSGRGGRVLLRLSDALRAREVARTLESVEERDVPRTYFSEAQWPLVYRGEPGAVPILTVESCPKWYALYLVMPDGSVEEVTFAELHELADRHADRDMSPYVDHVPNPELVPELASARGWTIDSCSYEMMVGRWESEVKSPEKYDH